MSTTFTFNNQEYNTDSISDKAKAIVSLLQRAQDQLDLYGVAKETLLVTLEGELNPKEVVVDKPRPVPVVARPQPAVKAKVTEE